MIYGYIRVSTDKQTTDNQRFEILKYADEKKLAIDEWIEETVSSTRRLALGHMRLCWLMRNCLLSITLEVGITRDNSLICLSFKRRMQSRCYEPFGINQQSHNYCYMCAEII
jgi:hypothetical protein